MTGTTASKDDLPRPWSWAILAGLILLTIGVGWLAGLSTQAKIPTWYATLRKPDFTPPSWLFPVAWTFLYITMAIAAWHVWKLAASPGRTRGLVLFFVQLALNGAWSPAFFTAESPLLGMIVIVPLWLGVLATLVAFWRLDRVSGLLFVPYLAWVSFASLLNATILAMNS